MQEVQFVPTILNLLPPTIPLLGGYNLTKLELTYYSTFAMTNLHITPTTYISLQTNTYYPYNPYSPTTKD
jgi:hypothetical protein